MHSYVATHKGKVVGFVSVTTDVHVDVLCKSFDLSIYNNLQASTMVEHKGAWTQMYAFSTFSPKRCSYIMSSSISCFSLILVFSTVEVVAPTPAPVEVGKAIRRMF